MPEKPLPEKPAPEKLGPLKKFGPGLKPGAGVGPLLKVVAGPLPKAARPPAADAAALRAPAAPGPSPQPFNPPRCGIPPPRGAPPGKMFGVGWGPWLNAACGLGKGNGLFALPKTPEVLVGKFGVGLQLKRGSGPFGVSSSELEGLVSSLPRSSFAGREPLSPAHSLGVCQLPFHGPYIFSTSIATIAALSILSGVPVKRPAL
mmetsp:Transcript_102685/g.229317  ORF Transcript_102685/g.229317 Transcript_102685/m.229317 type:complete len:203 (-) Transcript_102685:1006-1614(-)